MARARWFAAIAVALATATPGPVAARGRGAANIQWDEGSRAAVDTWTQDEGCPARTSATESQTFSGARTVAWKFQTTGDIEGDPLVWKGKTFVVERQGTRRTVHVLATATGAKLYRQSYESVLPPAPCVEDGRMVLRTSPKTIQGLAVGEKGFSGKWTVTAKTGIGPPTLVRDEVYVVVDGVLERRTFGSKQAVWPKPKATAVVKVGGVVVPGKSGKGGPTEYPRPSVRGGSVFIATGSDLLEVDRTTGTVRRKAALRAEAHPTGRVMVGFCDVLVQRRGSEPATDRFGRSDSGLAVRPLLSLPFGAASLGCDWVARVAKSDGSAAVVRVNGPDDAEDGSFDFATPKAHAEFVSASVPPSAANDVVFLGGRSFDADRLDLLDAEAMPCVARIVPLRERVLVVEARNRLTAWKSTRGRAADPGWDGLGTEPIPPAQAVVEGGRRVAGGFSIDPKTKALRTGAKPAEAASWPMASVQAVVADGPPRRLLWGSSPSEAAAAATSIARAIAASRIVTLVPKGVEAGDADLVQRIHSAAVRLGAPESDLDAAEAALAELESRADAARDDAKADAVAEELKAALQSPADVLVEIAESLPEKAPPRYATALVRAASEVYPYHRGAAEWVRRALPQGLAPTTFRDLREWLAFLDLTAGTEIEVFPAGKEASPSTPTSVSEPLAEARAKWRPDLHGLRNGPLLVIATGERLDLLARFLILGRVVSDELDRVFAPIGPRREEEETLVLHFFPDQAEYILQSQGGTTAHGTGGLENTAGHYDPSANLTRMFLPGSAHDADSVAGVYAHELTHHWIARRRPPRSGDPDGDNAGGPGYWIVEGIADFVQGFDFDVAAATAVLQNPRADYVDIVSHAAAKDRIPWPKLLGMTHGDAAPLLGEGEVRIPLRWRMGLDERFTIGALFYAQSAATTAYLYLADDGKHRAALLAFLYDHYAGHGDSDALLKTLGFTADELGSRVEAWCKATVSSSPR